MLLIRPEIPGTALASTALDGVPLPSGFTFDLCYDCFGPAIEGAWFVRATNQFSGDTANVVAIEFIWDKKPCKGKGNKASHQIITAIDQANIAKKWQVLVNANPHRYALMIGSLQDSASPGQKTIITQ